MTSSADLTRDAVAAIDQSGQIEDILTLPDHLRDALWRVESANLKPEDTPGGLVVAGMGGSAVGGALARAALGDRASRPITLARDYALPAWTTPDTTVLCSSYSGDTEETLAAYEAAGALGARRIVATTGGQLANAARSDGVPVVPVPAAFQPRVAVGYSLVIALEVAGASLTAPIAYRWKTQINENAKTPSFAGELPELDHNEIVGWAGAPGVGRFSAVFLDDSDLHPRTRQRIELARALIQADAAATLRVETIGETRTDRLVSLVLLGDLVSIYLAVLSGVDPTPVVMIDRLKSALAHG